MGLFETLKDRGYFYQMTNEDEVRKLLNGAPTTCYVGIDPTAESLHIGHCFPLILAKYLQDAGHKIIIVLGGATAMIGDPSGKSDMRKMVTSEFINKNRVIIERAISQFIHLDGSNPAIIVNNADWFKGYDYIDFMRDIGVHFNVNKMLSCDAYKKRLETGGLTFYEMGYMLMQAYDFVYLNKNYGCRIQFGGSDQWTNILAGADLGRKLSIEEGRDAETFQAFTHVLLLNADGEKMGKTVKGAVWVDKDKCSPYDFYQYFYNCDDRDVERFLRILTYVPLDDIAEIMKGDIREAKKRMAYELTKLVHGKLLADEAIKIAGSIFSGNVENIPEQEIDASDFGDTIAVADLLVLTALTKSKGESRRLIEQGGISIDSVVISDVLHNIDTKDLKKGIIIKKGKKQFIKVVTK